ncbi:Gfo/Idh/MocA family oxidoreductase [Nonomuraea sp. PA05]|uniref:Gfo/Idh/MocA family protein n=1 Tax=Nonomuraea sp. PA05 TaxID=2604466 RepID=UPI0011D61907|nr:Gfo/Idh/MocA family oxidoreductase [Nonomuraea sp. PA05]TYB56573.1 Gfo/Idh/MocA family oxidoreductase [Nonomuraea sp. PA05]
MSVVRLGLLGAGGVAALHAQAALAMPGEVRVTAVCDVDQARAAELAARSGARVHPDHLSMLDAVDALIVCTPHALHLAPALDAAAAGVHVLMEKPMATSLADCDAMADACAKAGVVLFLGHVQHYLPITRKAHEVVASGEIGRPVAIVDRRATDYRRDRRPAWFFDPALAGGGAVMNIGAHCVDRSTWLAGAPAVRVTARLEKRGLPVETEGLLHLELANDVLVTVSVTTGAIPPMDEIEVLGSHGTLRASRADGVWLAARGRAGQLAGPGDIDQEVALAFRDQLRDFAAAVRGERPAAIGPEVGRAVVATVLAAYASADTGEAALVAADRQPLGRPLVATDRQPLGEPLVAADRRRLGQP